MATVADRTERRTAKVRRNVRRAASNRARLSVFRSAFTLESAAAVGLLVPSVLISGVHGAHLKNCLINPLHPEFHQVKLSGPISFAVDPRFPSGVESSD